MRCCGTCCVATFGVYAPACACGMRLAIICNCRQFRCINELISGSLTLDEPLTHGFKLCLSIWICHSSFSKTLALTYVFIENICIPHYSKIIVCGISTDQKLSFTDALVEIPSSELDCLEGLIHWQDLRQHLRIVPGDNISMVKILLLPTWYDLVDEAVSHAVARALVFLNFCNFTLAGS